MNNAIQQFRPALNWISAALISLFVISFAIFAEDHVPPGATLAGSETEFCTGKSHDNNRLFIRYH